MVLRTAVAACGFKMTPKLGMHARRLRRRQSRQHGVSQFHRGVSGRGRDLRGVADLGLQSYVQFFVNPNAVFGVRWNFVRKVTTADSAYGPIGTIITARNSSALDVAQIGQVDLTWYISRFVQLHALMRVSLQASPSRTRARSQLRRLPAADRGAMGELRHACAGASALYI